MQEINRRTLLAFSGLGALSLGTFALTGCAPSGADANGTTTVRFAWWGGADRQKAYLSALKTFSKEADGIKVEPEFADYDAYQERMTTQMAARDVPEVFWIPSAQVLTYRNANIYRDLSTVKSLDLSAFSDAEIESFKLKGTLDTLPKSMFSPVLRYNQTFLDEDGVTLPENLTWDSLAELLKEYAKNNSAGRTGITYGGYHDMPFELFLRQRGEDLWTEDGKLGASVDGVAAWIDWWEDLRRAGATPSISEQDGVVPAWSMVGDKVLTSFANSNHIVDEAAAFPDYVFDQRDMPAAPDAAQGYNFTYFSRFAMYSGIDDARVDAAAELMSFNLNSIELLKLVGLSAGAPPSSKLLDEYEEFATPDEKKVIAVTKEIAAKEKRPRYEAPAGSGNWRNIMVRELEEVTIGGAKVTDAAQSFVDSVAKELESA